MVKTIRRPEPVSVENGSDELGVGVKGQSNPVIAGPKGLPNPTKLRIPLTIVRESDYGG